MTGSVVQLQCPCKNDPWGKKGSGSLAARYAAQAPGTGFRIDENMEYSEMWMGAYPTNPARVIPSGEELQKALDAQAEKLLGKAVIDKFGTNLPFIPKILCIQKALPLQIHPDKELAAKLHQEDPSKFGDTNHKPEIAVALSTFEAFIGWKPLPDIEALFSGLNALRQRFYGDPAAAPLNSTALRQLVLRILKTPDADIEKVMSELMSYPRDAFESRKHGYIADLLPRLAKQYSKADPGSLVALFTMNYVVLKPGESIFVPTDGIHAYLYGDIVECMARSDNMLATGFSPPEDRDDPELFTKALTFSPRSPEEALLQAKPFDRAAHGRTRLFAPPMEEFRLLLMQLAAGETEATSAIAGPSILVVTGGEGKMAAEGSTFDLKEGFVYFVGCGVEVRYESSSHGLQVHRAYCEA